MSVVVPAFNHGRCLSPALDSLLAQTLPGTEIIVVDDGSTDDTPAVLAAYAGRVRTVRQSNRGMSSARNAGLAMARGPYIAFLDADDVVAPTKLQRQVAVLDAESSVGWTYCDVLIEDEVAGRAVRASDRFGYRGRRLDGRLFPELVRGNFIPVIAVVARRAALEQAGPFDETLSALEDWDLWLRLALVADARHVPEVLATYRWRAGGTSRDRARMDRHRFVILDALRRTRPDAFAALGTEGRRIVADTENWFGDAAYARGDWGEARRRLAASLRVWPWQRRALGRLALSALRAGTG